MTVQYDASFDISIGRHRKSKTWKTKEVKWSELLTKLSQTKRTPETFKEYNALPKDQRDEKKDVGGFVGGHLAGGRRKPENVVYRQLITLDADYAAQTLWEDLGTVLGCAACMYSTHSHAPGSPRLRVIIPLDREVAADEYIAISRKVAEIIGIDQFDPTTYQPERLMYWPSTSVDGEYLFEYQDGPWLSADSMLALYRDWKDSSQWPMGEKEKDIPRASMKKQGDPLEKPGIVGAFNRAHTIQEAIALYLPDVYEPCADGERYTYVHGSTAGGLVIYEDKFAFSHHGTDPSGGKLCNAFDLVRIHKYGLQDEKAAENTPINKLPSYLAMCELAAQDSAVKRLIATERTRAVQEDFEGLEDEGDQDFDFPAVQGMVETGSEEPAGTDMSWTEKMDMDKKGNLQSTIKNLFLILENDPRFKGKIRFDLFAQQMVITAPVKWRRVAHSNRFLIDSDVHQIEYYIEAQYGIPPGNKIIKALSVYGNKYNFHPVQQYLDSLSWDGVERVDRLLIDYMGAEDSDYVRTVTRKTLVAGVARVINPGCKFEYMLTLVGPQGKKKSALSDRLGGEWFSDTFSMKTLEKGKEGMESLQGVWIQEVPELTGMSKADVNHVKSFMASRVDRYRPAYARIVQTFPRQCILVGTTNDWNFLRDATGNRRFWPIDILHTRPTKDVFKDLTEAERGQIWAEALHYYRAGETLYLSPAMEVAAMTAQTDHTEQDERSAAIAEFLEKPVPKGWGELSYGERKARMEVGDFDDENGETEPRTAVTAVEIWTELFGSRLRDMNNFNTRFIHEIMAKMPGWERAKSKLKTGHFGKQITYLKR